MSRRFARSLPIASRRARPVPPPRAGFTLVELMVGLSLGALVIASVYTIGVSGARHFQEQQRVSQLQLATRIALDRIRRDVSLAGFGGSPDSDAELPAPCGRVAGAPRVVAVALTDHAPSGTTALSALAGAAEAGVQSDSLVLAGNFDTGDVYLVRDIEGAGRTTINLQTNWQGFRRSFMATPDGATIDTALFSQVFARGRMVSISHPTGGRIVAPITSATTDSGGLAATITVSGAIPSCFDVCLGCTIAPISGIEYVIAPAAGPFIPRDPTATGNTGPNTVLVRQEVDLSTGLPIAGTARTILEWAIDFDVDLFIDTAAVGGIPNVLFFDDGAAAANAAATPGRVRSVAISVSARTPEQDDRFPYVARTAGAPLTRFRAFTTRDGASRVRTARAEIMLHSVAYRGM